MTIGDDAWVILQRSVLRWKPQPCVIDAIYPEDKEAFITYDGPHAKKSIRISTTKLFTTETGALRATARALKTTIDVYQARLDEIQQELTK